uniref:RRM domain-containing protein n=1 Tax=Ditylenchus dipsaci TaxID=166011 RepID=A0A915CLH0_9BILA
MSIITKNNYKMSFNRVFVGRLNEFMTNDDLGQFFRRCGRITDVFRKLDYAFVDFEDAYGAEIAIRELHNTILCGYGRHGQACYIQKRGITSCCQRCQQKGCLSRTLQGFLRFLAFCRKHVPCPNKPPNDQKNHCKIIQRSSENELTDSAKKPDSNQQKKDALTALSVKLETSSLTPPTDTDLRTSKDTAIERGEQIFPDGNFIAKPSAEVEGVGFSEHTKRLKVALQPEIGETQDTQRAVTSTDTITNKYGIPDCFNDCKVVIEGKVLHANKSLLSIYSAKIHSYSLRPNFIYPSSKQVTAANLECLLNVAKKLEVSSVTARCKLFLNNEAECTLSMTKKLYLAQLYGLHSFQTYCINQCNSIAKLKLLKTEEEYELLDGNTMRLLIENATADL